MLRNIEECQTGESLKAYFRPQKGSSIFTEPIREIHDVMAIRESLRQKEAYRDDLLFMLGINNSLQMSTLLKLRVRDVSDMQPGSHKILTTAEPGEAVRKDILVITASVYHALLTYLADRERKGRLNTDNFLFSSRKGNDPLTLSAVNGMVKTWTSEIRLGGNYGATSLRKTWGYHQRTRFGVAFGVLRNRYGHDSTAATMRFLGFSSEPQDYILAHNEIGALR